MNVVASIIPPGKSDFERTMTFVSPVMSFGKSA
jgi:hypothetical protein